MKPDIVVHVEHHPLSGVGHTIHELPSGLCLTEIIEIYNTDIPLTHLWININGGPSIPAIMNVGASDEWSPWDTIRPKKNCKVNIRSKSPEGTGGPGSMFGLPPALSIGLSVAFPFILAPFLLAGAFSSISGFLQPPTPKSPKQGNTSYSLTGTSNDAPEVGQVVPYVAGRIKIYPLRAS